LRTHLFGRQRRPGLGQQRRAGDCPLRCQPGQYVPLGAV
jgi:hypothetical protein